MHEPTPNRTWGLPLVGLVGTVAAMLFTWGRIATEPGWKTALQGVGFGVATTIVIMLVLGLAVRRRF